MFSKHTTVLLVTDSSSYVLPIVRCLSSSRDLSIDILICSPARPGPYRHSGYIRNLYWVKKMIGNDFPGTITHHIKKSGADLVIPSGEIVAGLFIEYRKTIENLAVMQPVPDKETLDLVINKWKLNSWLRSEDFPSVNSVLLKELESGKMSTSTMKFPLLLKPLVGSGGKGIRLLQDQEALELTMEELADQGSEYLIQEHITGYDIDISFFAFNGEIIFYTIQRAVVSGGFTFAKGIEFIKNEDFLELAGEILTKLNYTGIAHLDFRYDELLKKYILLDFNLRYWSTLEGSESVGVNFPLLIAAYCLESTTDRPDYRLGYFFSTKAAFRTVLQNLGKREKLPVKFRYTQLYYSIRDPRPEIFGFMENLKQKWWR